MSIVLDLKTPDSGESDKNLYENISLLKKRDPVKFVICSKEGYDWVRFKLDECKPAEESRRNIFFSRLS